jgi:penicillin-binding protein 2
MTLNLPFSKNKRRDTARVVGRQYQSTIVGLIVSLFLFGAIGSRLAYLQIVQGNYNRQRAEDNRVRIVPKQPVRGNIFDRKGKVLATTKLTHAAYLWPKVQTDPQWPSIRHRIASLLNIPEAELQKKVQEAGYNSPTLLRIARNLNTAQITAIEEFREELKGLEVDIETVRYYPNGEVGSHILGYTGELTQKGLAKRRKDGYRLGDVVGKMGVESSFEKLLRGEWGGLQLEVDGAGKVMRILGQKEAKPGNDVTLTLDLELQKAAEEALGERKGAVVALDPNNGAVLAMVSYPRFDPNIFSARITPEIWKKVQGKGNPFVNRALRGFPPASTFKIVTDTAGLESGKFPPNTMLQTSAYLRVGGTAFGEWNHAGFGRIGYVRALAMSSNTFHGQIGRGVGGPVLIEWARRYGFGSPTGVDLSDDEAPGLIADDAWKRKNVNLAWSEGDTVNMSIGQGFTLATPLQVAVMFASQGNGGYKVKPHFNVADNQKAFQARVSLKLKPSTLETLRKGLRAVVAEGTAKVLNTPDLPPVAGKSGTAQAPPGENHAWFGGFAPFDKPSIVVVAFAEHSGGGGGSTAGPMVKKVMETYFKKPEDLKKEKEEKEKKENKKPAPVNRR